MSRKLKFYFDPVSPYVYYAFKFLPKFVARTNVQVEVLPVFFFGLLNFHKQVGPAEIVAKRKMIYLDCLRLAKLHNLPFQLPDVHPFNPILALRMATAISDSSKRLEFANKLVDVAWGKGHDLMNTGVLIKACEECEIDGIELLQKANSDETKNLLRSTTDEAAKHGIFGVPSFQIDKELFWGSDRFDLMDEYLKGGLAVDYNKLDMMMKTPFHTSLIKK